MSDRKGKNARILPLKKAKYTTDVNRSCFFQEEDVDLITVYTDIYNMRIELEKMKKPIGTRESPARSCKDLFHGHPQLKDGKKIWEKTLFV